MTLDQCVFKEGDWVMNDENGRIIKVTNVDEDEFLFTGTVISEPFLFDHSEFIAPGGSKYVSRCYSVLVEA